MFRKFFKNVAEKLFNAGKNKPVEKVQPKPKVFEVPEPIRHIPEKRHSGTFANNPPGTKRIPPTLMPPFNPEPRKHPQPTSRYAHKPWPKSKKVVA